MEKHSCCQRTNTVSYTHLDVYKRQQTALAADHKGTLDLGEYQGVDCIRTQDGLVYAAAYDLSLIHI